MFNIFVDKKGEYRFNLKAPNNRILIYSTESYTQRHNAKGAIYTLVSGRYRVVVRKEKSDANKPYLVFVGLNGEDIARSETYYNVGNVNRARKTIQEYLSEYPKESSEVESVGSSSVTEAVVVTPKEEPEKSNHIRNAIVLLIVGAIIASLIFFYG